jgi:hypothetical protein
VLQFTEREKALYRRGLRAARGTSEAGMRSAFLPVVAIRTSFPPEVQCRALFLPKLRIEVQPPQPLSTPRSLGVRNSIPRRHFNSAEVSSDKPPYVTRVWCICGGGGGGVAGAGLSRLRP